MAASPQKSGISLRECAPPIYPNLILFGIAAQQITAHHRILLGNYDITFGIHITG